VTIDRALLELMTDTIVFAVPSSLSQYGVPTFSTSSQSMSARIVTKHEEVRDVNGAVKEAQGHAYCASTSNSFTPTVESRMTLSNGKTPPILRVEQYPDESSTHHFKIVFGY